MDISELVFCQKNGIFFVWRMGDGRVMTTLLRNRTNISLEIQIENAITDGRSRMWILVGIGNWYLRPVESKDCQQENSDLGGVPFIIYNVTATLLRLKNLPERELRSTQMGMQEMREKWIPYLCERLRKVLWGIDE
jgi:hypothetical protein